VGGCKADLREIRYESVDWVELIQCGGRWSRAFINSPGSRDILISLKNILPSISLFNNKERLH
jgi:hypothetical protein